MTGKSTYKELEQKIKGLEKTLKETKPEYKGLRLQANKSGKVWVFRIYHNGNSQEFHLRPFSWVSLIA